jgi:hypothetical protein
VRAVHQHDPAQVGGAVGAEDFVLEAALAQHRNQTAVVNVRMTEQHRVEARGIERELAVACGSFAVVTLIHAAFDQDPFAVRFEEIL